MEELRQCYTEVLNAAQRESWFRKELWLLLSDIDDQSFTNFDFSDVYNRISGWSWDVWENAVSAIDELDSWINQRIQELEDKMRTSFIIQLSQKYRGMTEEQAQEYRKIQDDTHNAYIKLKNKLDELCN